MFACVFHCLYIHILGIINFYFQDTIISSILIATQLVAMTFKNLKILNFKNDTHEKEKRYGIAS
jgi:hypothetical protein